MKEVNIVVMECYYKSNPIDENDVPLKEYRQKMYRKWLERGPFGDATEQGVCYQARVIRKNEWLTEIELDMIKRRIDTTGPQETDQEENQDAEDSLPDSDELVARAKLKEIIIVNELKEIYDLGEKAERIIF